MGFIWDRLTICKVIHSQFSFMSAKVPASALAAVGFLTRNLKTHLASMFHHSEIPLSSILTRQVEVFSCNSSVIIFATLPCSTYSLASARVSCGHVDRTKDSDSLMADTAVSCFYALTPHGAQDQTQLTSHHNSHLFPWLCYEDIPSPSSIFPPGTAHTALLKLVGFCTHRPINQTLLQQRSLQVIT